MGATREMWAVIPPEDRRRRTQNARRKQAVKIVAEQFDELPEEDQDKIIDAIFPSGDAA
jgi:hypothetical protein